MQNGLMQNTLKSAISCSGVGVHSGKTTYITLLPAPAGSGICFRRTDVTDKNPVIPAAWDSVIDTQLCTVLANEDGVRVSTVEHLLSAMAGCGIDNAVIEIDGPEVPIMDGSAEPFVFLIECAGLERQSAPRKLLRVKKQVQYTEGDKTAILEPAVVPSYSFEIDFDTPIIGNQQYGVTLVNGSYKSEISRARTFGFLHEVEALRKLGLARGGSLENAIVIDEDRILNKDGLRYGDEFVRHKILDAIGDLYLSGAHLLGHFHGVRAGHAINNKVLHTLFADDDAWEIVDATGVAAENADRTKRAMACA